MAHYIIYLHIQVRNEKNREINRLVHILWEPEYHTKRK